MHERVVAVILNYNDPAITMQLIDRIRDYNVLYKIIIVDNASTDNSYELLSSIDNTKVDLLHMERNRGYAAGNNAGCRYAIDKYHPKYIFIANPDVYFNEQAIKMIINAFNRLKDAGQITGIMNCSSSAKLPCYWRLPVFLDCLMENHIILSKLFAYRFKKSKKAILCVDVVPGSFFAINTDAYCDVGGFDEETFLYYEENILAYKLKEKGYRNYVLTKVKYDHFHSVSIDKSIKSKYQKFLICQKSRLVYCKKYLGVNRFQEALLWFSFYFGFFNYSVFRKIYKAL